MDTGMTGAASIAAEKRRQEQLRADRIRDLLRATDRLVRCNALNSKATGPDDIAAMNDAIVAARLLRKSLPAACTT